MAMMLGSFTQGMFGSANAVMSMYGMYQGIQQTQNDLNAAAAVKAASDADAANQTQNTSDTSAVAQAGDGAPGTPTGSAAPAPTADPGAGPIDLGKLVGAKPQPAAQPAAAIPVGSSPTAASDSATATPVYPPAPAPSPVAPVATAANPTPQLPVWSGLPQAPPNSAVQTNVPGYTMPQGATAPVTAMPTSDIPPTAPQYVPPPSSPTGPSMQGPDLSHLTNTPVGANLSRWINGGPPPPAGVPAQAVPVTPPGAPPANDAGTPGLGARLLQAINPIGSAQAATPSTQGLPEAPQDTGTLPAAGAAPTPQTTAPVPPQGARAAPMPPSGAAGTQGVSTAAPTPAAAPTTPTAAPAQVSAGAVPVTPARGDPGTVAPDQKGPSVQSESSPTVVKPVFDQRPYVALAQQRPQLLAVVDAAAAKYGVSPQRLALHGYLESGLNPNAPDGAAGEIGPFQLTPQTIRMLDPKGTLNPRTFDGSAALAAINIHRLDAEFGADSPGSILAYQSGPGGAVQAGQNFSQFASTHPVAMQYLSRAYGGAPVNLGQGSFTSGGNITPAGVVNAGVSGGPDGVLNYITSSGPRGMAVSDLWRQAETALVTAAAGRHDIQGMQNARDFVAQASQAGTNGYLMQAHQALMAGDGSSAAQFLARAHAFVPDGSIGRFGVDGSGQVWGQQFSEKDPTVAIGAQFKVTPDNMAPLLITTKNPNTYLNMIDQQQKLVAQTEYQRAHAQYMHDEIGVQLTGQGVRADAQTDAAQIRADGQRDAAQTRADAAANNQRSFGKQVDTESGKLYNEDTAPDLSEDQRGTAARIYSDVRMNAGPGQAPPPHAQAVANGIIKGQLSFGPDGKVFDPKDPNRTPKAYLSPGMTDYLSQLAGVKRQTSSPTGSPVGAGAATAQSSGGAANPTLGGSLSQSSAIPVTPQQNAASSDAVH